MKKKLRKKQYWILSIIPLVVSGYCTTAVLSGARRMLGTEKAMMAVGECNQDGDCVLQEKQLYPNGHLFQYLDNNADGLCDHVIEWKPIDDPHYGRFWERVRHRTCDVNTEKYRVTFVNPATNLTMGLTKFTKFDDAGEPIDYDVMQMRWSGAETKILWLEPGTYIVTIANMEGHKIENWNVFMVPHDRVVELQ